MKIKMMWVLFAMVLSTAGMAESSVDVGQGESEPSTASAATSEDC